MVALGRRAIVEFRLRSGGRRDRPLGKKSVKALRFDHISLYVRDPSASARFYAEVLGLDEIENKTRRADIRWFGVDGDRAIHLIGGGEDPPPDRPRSAHFAMTSAHFDDALRFLTQMGVEYINSAGEAGRIAIRADGVRQVYFRDPDNYWIEINEAEA
jgi:lactoylglutathione lyase